MRLLRQRCHNHAACKRLCVQGFEQALKAVAGQTLERRGCNEAEGIGAQGIAQQHYTMGYTVCYIKTFVLRLCNHFCVIIV